MKKLLTFLLILFIFAASALGGAASSAYAHNNELGSSRINPASLFYFLKSVREILELKLSPATNIRAARELEFANRRIREANSLAGSSREDLISPTLEKYWSHLGQLFGITDLYNPGQLLQIRNSFNIHTDALADLYWESSHPQARRSLRLAIFRISLMEDNYIKKLNSLGQIIEAEQFKDIKLKACNFLTQEASSSALNENERLLYQDRSQKCSGDLIGL